MQIVQKVFNTFVNFITSSVFFSNFVTVILIILLMAASFGIGALYTQVKALKGELGTAAIPTAGNPTADAGGTQVKPEDVAKQDNTDVVRGNKNANVSLIEYSDYDCPFCVRFHPTLKQALAEFGDKVNWVYRHFPLTQLHPDARRKAEASECVKSLGGDDRFWAFTDALYENSETIADMQKYAQNVGVDGNKFKDCFENNKQTAEVQKDIDSGTKAGVQGTPGLFIVNKKTGKVETVPGAVPYDQLKAAIESVL